MELELENPLSRKSSIDSPIATTEQRVAQIHALRQEKLKNMSQKTKLLNEHTVFQNMFAKKKVSFNDIRILENFPDK